MSELEGQVVAITGGGRGIGRAIGAASARRGALVAVGDVDGSIAVDAAAAIGARLGAPLDVRDEASFVAFLEQVERELGPIDVLVNNAGVMPVGPLVDESDDETRRALEVNLGGVVRGTRLAAARMAPRRRGHIVNVASMLGELASPGVATYCATKFGVIGFSDAARRELRGSGVMVSTVLPNFVRSDLTAGVASVRGFRSLTVDEVADAVVDVMLRPRPRRYVRRGAGFVMQARRLLPTGGIDVVMRWFGLDRIFLAADHDARRRYAERAFGPR
jgi:NAD(P)-dependent dehydrogenase (short-subunit alcohol dehydrogenase family)